MIKQDRTVLRKLSIFTERSTSVWFPPHLCDLRCPAAPIQLYQHRLWRCIPAPAVATYPPVLLDFLSGLSGHRFWRPEPRWFAGLQPLLAPAPRNLWPTFSQRSEHDSPARCFVSPDPIWAKRNRFLFFPDINIWSLNIWEIKSDHLVMGKLAFK